MARRLASFSFGRNWNKYLDSMPAAAVERTQEYLGSWLGDLSGQTFLDIGSGSGLTGLAAFELGAKVRTFDADPASVAATQRLSKGKWQNSAGSILDDTFVAGLGTFDIVSSWGVLHHTGDVWKAIDNAAGLVKPGGRLWIALYRRTYAERRSLRTKRLYNLSPELIKRVWRGGYGAAKLAKAALRRDFHPIRRYQEERGMNWWRDTEDWLGGLPYQPVGPGEVLGRLRPLGFDLTRLQDALGEGRIDVYLFARHDISELDS
jgi:2-polyprenyl-6-hydroxyphenyl methylase/3-demethylubiquinone-9 3-methyltransferase